MEASRTAAEVAFGLRRIAEVLSPDLHRFHLNRRDFFVRKGSVCLLAIDVALYRRGRGRGRGQRAVRNLLTCAPPSEMMLSGLKGSTRDTRGSTCRGGGEFSAATCWGCIRDAATIRIYGVRRRCAPVSNSGVEAFLPAAATMIFWLVPTSHQDGAK